MKDEIIEELWRIKDQIGEELNEDFSNLDTLLEEIDSKSFGPEVDLSERKKSA